MYAYIKGTLEETGEDYIVVEAGGLPCASFFEKKLPDFVLKDLSVSAVHGGRGKSLYLSACAGGCDDLIWISHQR